MHLQTTSSLLLALSLSSYAVSIPKSTHATPRFPTNPRVVHEYTNPTWLENLAVRSNGNILVTEMSPVPRLHHISNPESPLPVSTVIHTFNSTGAILGIAEVSPDVFLLVGGPQKALAQPIPGKNEVWKCDFNTPGRPSISKAGNIPQITFANGITKLPGSDAVLIADSYKGSVYRFDIKNSSASLVLDYPEMKPLKNDLGLVLGVNGVHIYGDFLYFTESFASTIYRIKIDTRTGYAKAGATVEKVTHADTIFLDDFIMDNRGGLYSAAGEDETLQYAPWGAQNMTTVAGSAKSLSYAGSTALAFGRTSGETNYGVLYVTTDGGMAGPVNGTLTEGGKVIALYPKQFP